MGVVFLAVDQEVRGEMFAVKVLRPEIRANPESLRLLREEVRRTRALRHPHIVGVYSLNSDPSGVYMLMEYLEGKSLKTVLDEEFGRGMPLIRAWPMIYDVGAALAYAHDHNVIHSDIKPSNVIITSSGSCKLLDFGIARADRNRTTTRDATAIGALTPAYACCEMFEGRAPDQSDDVYAFACVIYEMLTGRHPYGRMAAVEARARKLQPAPIKALTNRQNAALARALEFNRERRTASVEILLEGLKGMANNQRDRRAWVTSGAAVAAVFAVSSGWFWEHHNAHRESAADLRPTTAPAPAPSPEPNPFGTPVTSKAEHGQQAARPDTGVAGPSTAASPSNVKSKTTAAVIAVPATLPAAMTAALPLAPAAAPVPTTPGAAAPLPTTPAAARAAAPVPAANLEAVLPAANKPAVAPATLPVETKVAAVSTAATTTQAATGAPAVKGTTAKTDGTLPTEPAKPISAALAAPAAADLEAFASTPVPIAESPPLTPAGVAITSAAIKKEIDRPPFGKKVPGVVATTESQSKMQSEEYCPYPAEARKEVQTGTVVMLVYVTPDGSTANAELDEDGSSGSPVLDQAAVKCVRELGRFPVKLVGSKPVGYWARTKFVWSFGG
jgi:TonB family protein